MDRPNLNQINMYTTPEKPNSRLLTKNKIYSINLLLTKALDKLLKLS